MGRMTSRGGAGPSLTGCTTLAIGFPNHRLHETMKIHLTAIGGTGMAALAGLLKEAGHEVRGSDGVLYPPMSTLLERLKIPVFEGYAAENLDWAPELVVLGNACRKDHVEYLEAQTRGLRVASFPETLAEHFLAERHSIVVAGTHGKTTTSSLLAHILATAGLEPGMLIGGIPLNFGQGFALGQPPYFVVEGDEYDCACFDKRPKFAHYRPQTVILTSVEFDHADIYPSFSDVQRAFALLIDLIPENGYLLVSADDPSALELARHARCTVETYAVYEETADTTSTRRIVMPLHWYASFESLGGGRKQLSVMYQGDDFGSFELKLSGAHNMANSLAALAIARHLGIDATTIGGALASFKGVARRQQVIGNSRNITIIDDFAHHPTAIGATLRGLRNRRGRLVAVFEPRSASAKRNIFQEALPEALGVADHVVLAPLYLPEKVPAEQRLDLGAVIGALRHKGTDAFELATEQIVDHLRSNLHPGDTVVFMSSGDFGGLPSALHAALSAHGS